MSDAARPVPPGDVIEVDLRNPVFAALLAWAWPGAGHLYQRRYAKGALFMICILGTFFYGLAMANGHAVYSSFTRQERRWQYVCQLGVGTPAMLAIVQRQRVIIHDEEPLFGGLMAPPYPVEPEHNDQLAEWHRRYHRYFDLATLYTMIAGLLNTLVIFDAYAGPMGVPVDDRKRQTDRENRRVRTDESKKMIARSEQSSASSTAT